ncbi:hypothetical protein DMA12_26635 [Amycolatopsis balhimycina DSM 5908]|uniref:DUF6294 domain-containing protein n=1 Tax=Amycolatopsis balhimycina DSM 5908 TaxID=1081091 RepID=A0A428WBR9_AMYBA|nr:DUF6294 family protein [Amycolatopsis balhimycina]RSM40532.1 hypothetical protein DMA12_26635 [Amycolatopsis balhimycina DSM 5908]
MKRMIRGLAPVLAAAAAGTALLAGAPAAQATALDVKSATWGQLHVGDCQQDNGTIVIRSDGTGDWSATTLTYQTHSGDVWHSGFDFKTTAGTKLFSAGTFDSPRMDDGNPPPHYFWSKHFTYDAALFSAVNIFKTIQHSSC